MPKKKDYSAFSKEELIALLERSHEREDVLEQAAAESRQAEKEARELAAQERKKRLAAEQAIAAMTAAVKELVRARKQVGAVQKEVLKDASEQLGLHFDDEVSEEYRQALLELVEIDRIAIDRSVHSRLYRWLYHGKDEHLASSPAAEQAVKATKAQLQGSGTESAAAKKVQAAPQPTDDLNLAYSALSTIDGKKLMKLVEASNVAKELSRIKDAGLADAKGENDKAGRGRQITKIQGDPRIVEPTAVPDVCPKCSGKQVSLKQIERRLRDFFTTFSVAEKEQILFCSDCGKVTFVLPPGFDCPIKPQSQMTSRSALAIAHLEMQGVPILRASQELRKKGGMSHETINRAVSVVTTLYLKPLYEAMLGQLMLTEHAAIDETVFDSLEAKGCGSSKKKAAPDDARQKNYMLAMRTDRSEPHPLFVLSPLANRTKDELGDKVRTMLPNLKSAVTDAYAPYKTIFPEGVKWQVCLVHFRRAVLDDLGDLGKRHDFKNLPPEKLSEIVVQKFVKADSIQGRLLTILKAIGQLYRNAALKREGRLSTEDAARYEHSAVDLMDVIENLMKNLEEEKFSGACTRYVRSLGGFAPLKTFLQDIEHISPDSNGVEREIRNTAILRKNAYFKQTETGREEMAIRFSLMQTAQLNGVLDVVDWLTKFCNAAYAHIREQSYQSWHANGGDPKQHLSQTEFDESYMKTFPLEGWLPWEYAARLNQ